jgi:hypothetical protein
MSRYRVPRGRAAACTHGVALVLVCLVACYQPEPNAGLPCSDDQRCPQGQVCNLRAQVCERPADDVWRFDSAAEFAAGGQLQGTLDPDGAVSAQRYLTGALRMRGANRLNAVDTRTAEWTKVSAAPDGTGFVRSIYQMWQDGIPPGAGVERADDFTVWFDGELFLEQGDWQLRLHCDDEGFLDLAPPGGAFARVVDSTYLAAVTVTFKAPVTGWYAMRGAVKDQTQFAHYLLEAGRDHPRRIEPERMRVAIGELRGVLVEGFDEPFLLAPRAVKLVSDVGGDLGTSPPADLGLGADAQWSLRYAGMFYVDGDQRVRLGVSSQGGHRLWIDRQLISDALGAATADATTEPIPLARGWHELVAEVSHRAAAAGGLALRVVDGDPRLLDRERMIPAEGALRLLGRSSTDTLPLPANGAARVALPMVGAASVALRAVNARYLATGALAELLVRVDMPTGPLVLRPAGALSGTTIEDYATSVPSAISTPLTGWAMLGRNNGATAGTFGPVALSVEYEGIDQSTGDAFSFVSDSRELPPELEVGAVHWTTEPAGAPVRVSLRSCGDAHCADEAWVDVVAPGDRPTLDVRPFVQVRVEAAMSQGKPIRLDSLEVAFQRR